jgi:hypothetical protein
MNDGFSGLFVVLERLNEMMECNSKDSASADTLLHLNSRERAHVAACLFSG